MEADISPFEPFDKKVTLVHSRRKMTTENNLLDFCSSNISFVNNRFIFQLCTCSDSASHQPLTLLNLYPPLVVRQFSEKFKVINKSTVTLVTALLLFKQQVL